MRVTLVRLLILVFLVPPPSLLAQTPSPEDVVRIERAKFPPRVSPDQAPVLLAEIARSLTRTQGGTWGLLVKPSGNNCGGFACDIVCNHAEHWDVLIDGPDAEDGYSGTAGPSWQPRGQYAPRVCSFVTVSNPPPPSSPPPSTPPPSTPPPVPSLDLSGVYLRLDLLDQKVTRIDQTTQAIQSDIRGFWEKHWPKLVTGLVSGGLSAWAAWKAKDTTPAPSTPSSPPQ